MNYKNRFLTSIATAIIALSLVGSAFGQTKTPTPLKEIGDVLVGRWTSEVVWAVDYPGLGKKGEKVMGYETMNWIIDGQALEGNWITGKTIGKFIIWWDASREQIKVLSLDSSGRTSEGTITKKGRTFIGKASGSFNDGRKVSYEWKTSLQDNGNTRIESGATILNGVRNEFRDVFKRVAK